MSLHSRRNLVGKEEKCEYEAFVTDPRTPGWGSLNDRQCRKEENRRTEAFVGKVVLKTAELEGRSWERKKNEHQAFVTNPGRQTESVKLRISN